MSDILAGQRAGEYTVTVSGPMDEGEWTWKGYANTSVDALQLATFADTDRWTWSYEAGKYVLAGGAA